MPTEDPSRRQRGEGSFDERIITVVSNLPEIMKVGLDVTAGDRQAFGAWLKTPNWAFDYETPFSLIKSGRDSQVLSLLQELEAGVVT